MHKDISWSHAPYKPYFHETGDIYICRVAPSETAIHLEWLPVADTYEIYYRLRNTDTFTLYEATAGCACTICADRPDALGNPEEDQGSEFPA